MLGNGTYVLCCDKPIFGIDRGYGFFGTGEIGRGLSRGDLV